METYGFADTSARYVKVTITKGTSSTSKITAQISEIDIFGKSGTSSSKESEGTSSSSNSVTLTDAQTPNELTDNSGANYINNNDNNIDNYNNNSPPSARDDRISTEENKPVVVAVLDNDKDADGDKIKIISVTQPKNGGTVIINENDTITFDPRRDYVGVDTFSYFIEDSEGKSDEGKVSATVRSVKVDKQQDIPRLQSSSKAQSINPSVNEQSEKQTSDTTVQKIRGKILSGSTRDTEIEALRFSQGPIQVNNSILYDNQQQN